MNKYLLASSSVLALLLLAGEAQAQQAANSGPAPGEIIVTAQKRAERIQDVPISITAVTGEQMARY